jgi:hypothetical protein
MCGAPIYDAAIHAALEAVRLAAGLPLTMWNRDLRARRDHRGGMAEASSDDRAKLAGHSGSRITRRSYDRDILVASDRVAAARAKFRKGSKGFRGIGRFLPGLAGKRIASSRPLMLQEQRGGQRLTRCATPSIFQQEAVPYEFIGTRYRFVLPRRRNNMLRRLCCFHTGQSLRCNCFRLGWRWSFGPWRGRQEE